jgi:hypothetical protein
VPAASSFVDPAAALRRGRVGWVSTAGACA